METLADCKNFFEKRLGKNTVKIEIERSGVIKVIVNSNVTEKFHEIMDEFVSLLPIGISWCYGIRDINLNKYKFINERST